MRSLHEIEGFVYNLVKLRMISYLVDHIKGNISGLIQAHLEGTPLDEPLLEAMELRIELPSVRGTWVIESEGEHALVYCTDVGALTTRGQLVRMVLFPTSVHFKYVDQLPVVSQLKGSEMVFVGDGLWGKVDSDPAF